MGGSVPLAIGALLAGHEAAWALTGDFSFVAAGHLGLLEAVLRAVPVRVVVFADGRASATGGQPVPRALLDRVLAGYHPAVRFLDDPHDPAAVARVLAGADAAAGLQVVVADYAALNTSAPPAR
jgi:TPP-dependent indolepyruvate ferredoxin oxidoreductase alpha subunit